MARVGLTVPLPGTPLIKHDEILDLAQQFGYDDLWSSETNRNDAFTPLIQAACTHTTFRLGTAVVPAFTRGPAVLAQSLASLSGLAVGGVVGGIGSSSPAIVEGWNGMAFDRPFEKVRDTVRFLRSAFTGDKVSEEYDTFSVSNFRLGEVPTEAPPLYIAALRSQMLRLAGREADGVILNWLSAEDVRGVVPYVHNEGPGREVVARLFVCPSEDIETVRMLGKRHIAGYLSVPAYASFQEWLGRGEQLKPMWDAWYSGDRQRAVQLVPDDVVDELIIHGSRGQCQEHVRRYVNAGVTTAVIDLMDWGMEGIDALRRVGSHHG